MDNSFVVTIPPSIISTVSGIVFLNASYCASNSGTSVGNCGRYAPSAIANTPTFAFVSTNMFFASFNLSSHFLWLILFDFEGMENTVSRILQIAAFFSGDHLHRQIADSSCLGRSRQYGSSGLFCCQPVQITGIGAAAYDMNLPVLTTRLFFQFF